MEFSYIQQKVEEVGKNYLEKYDIKPDPNLLILKLFEEVGELSEAFITYNGNSRPEKYLGKTNEDLKVELGNEIADVIGMALLLANQLEIDAEECIKNKWLDKIKSNI